jgi:SAM-dependent methyltransferase
MNKFNNCIFEIFYNENYLIRKGLHEAVSNFSPTAKGVLLDFGCGNKPYKNLFTNIDKYIGVDFSSTKHQLQIETETDLIYDGNKIPLNDNTVDIVITTEVFEHLFEIDLAINEIKRVLRPNGILFATCPFSYFEHEIPFDFARYTSHGLKYIMEKNDFNVISLEKKGNYISVICQFIGLYIYFLISKFKYFKFLLFPVLITPFYLFSELMSFILPRRTLKNTLYQSNVITCINKKKYDKNY